jgi:hypothetical protein
MIIWISLAAVVVVIIIICLLALRFLRADDSDAFDELPDEPRRPARASGDPRLPVPSPVAAARRPSSRRTPAEDSGWTADRSGRATDDRVAAYRDRGPDRQAGPHSQGRRASQGSGPARPLPAGARAARPAEAAAPATDWDSLSDVDYWAEVASDKPLTPATASAAGQVRDPGRGAKPGANSRHGGRGEPTVNLPVRQRPARTASTPGSRPADFGPVQPAGPRTAPGRYSHGAPEPVTESLAALARLGSPAPAGQSPGAQVPAAQMAAPPRHISQPRPAVRPAPPVPLDDDPLTSPSFPAINASDSRSYRARRHDSQPGMTRPGPAYPEPPQQFSTYPAAADRASSPPGGYQAQPVVPAGNPYGSFVSQPAASYPQQPPAASQQDGSYGGYTDGAQPTAADAGWYGAQAPAPGTGQSQAMPAFTTAPGYQAGTEQAAGYYPGYQAGQPETAAYAQPAYPGVQYDQRGYGSQEAAYGPDAYQGYPGYGNGGY